MPNPRSVQPSHPLFSARLRFGVAALGLAMVALMAAPAAGSAAGPAPLVVKPSPVVAPTTAVGTKANFEVTLENPGEQALLENIQLEGPGFNDFGIDFFGCGKVVEAGSCQIAFHFLPTSAGTKEVTARLFFATERPQETFTITGTAAAPSLTFTPASHDFGVLRRNSEEEAQFSFALENSGVVPVQLNNLFVSGSGNSANQFQFNSSDCNGTLQPGEVCSVPVSFRPNETGSFDAQLRASAGGEEFSAELTGVGARPEVTANPDPVAFGSVGVGAPAQTRTVTVTNTGLVPTAFFIAIVAGGDAGSFHVASEDCTMVELDPGDSCQVRLAFAPTATGTRTARLAMFGDDDGGLQVELSGEGEAAAVGIAPTGFDFGALASGRRSAPHTFSLVNSGSTPVAISSAQISGPNLDQFALAGDTCTGVTLAPGAGCAVSVRFAPDAVGTDSASLRVVGEGTVLIAPLAGQATVPSTSPHFRWSGFAALRGGSAGLGDVRCAAGAPCLVNLDVRLRVAAGGGVRSLALPREATEVAPGRTGQIVVALPARARALLGSGAARLVVRAHWATGALRGRSGARLTLK